MNVRYRRRQRRFESLESRCLLAAGLIPLDLQFPLSTSNSTSGVVVDATVEIKLNAMVLDPRADDAGDVSLTGYDFTSSGTIVGSIDGVELEATFQTDPVDTPNDPVIPIEVNPDTKTIDFELTQPGTFTAISDSGTFTGTFVMVTLLTADFNSRVVAGTTTVTFKADDRVETDVFPVQIPNALAENVEFPDANKPSVSGRVFNDANNDGLRDDSETGVANVRAVHWVSTSTTPVELESINTDANGYYAFYNLDTTTSQIRFLELPASFGYGKQNVGTDTTIDSDADSLSGSTPPIDFASVMPQLHVDAGLRATAVFWQNPNLATDVNNDGRTSAGDALAVINLLSRLEDGENNADLSGVRLASELFYDVNGDGRGNAVDALDVIFGLYLEEFGGERNSEEVGSLDWIADEKERKTQPVRPDTASQSKLF